MIENELQTLGQLGGHEHAIPPRIVALSRDMRQTHPHNLRFAAADELGRLLGVGLSAIQTVRGHSRVENRSSGFRVRHTSRP